MTVIKKAIVKSYDAATHKAAIQIAGSLGVWLEGIRVATDIPAADVVVDRQCTVLFIDPSNQDDALVLTIQGELPSGDGAGVPAGNTVVSETSFGQAPNKGTNTQYSRRDHTHGTPTDAVPAHEAGADPHSPYALTPVPYDAIVDGVGTRTGHHMEITDAITAGGRNIFVQPKPGGGRYNAFAVANGDAVESITGAGPDVLVSTVTIRKDETVYRNLQSNARVKVGGNRCLLVSITCKGATDTGFDIEGVGDPGNGLDCKMLNCRILETTGIALNYGKALHGLLAIDFYVRKLTGEHVIKTDDPDGMIIGLDIGSINVAPTKEPILLDGGIGAAPTFRILDAQMGCTVPSGFNNLKAQKLTFLSLINLNSVNEDGTGTPAIQLNNDIAGGGNYFVENVYTPFNFAAAAFNIPSTSTGLTILKGCYAAGGAALVTGNGRYNRFSCRDTSFLPDRWDFNNLTPAADNARALGTIVLAWSQVNAYIHRVRNYVDFKTVTAPSDPALSGTFQASREYVRAIDANNDGLFIKIKKAGAIAEVQIA